MNRYLILKLLAKLFTRKVLLKRELDRNPDNKIVIDKISKIDHILKRIEKIKRD